MVTKELIEEVDAKIPTNEEGEIVGFVEKYNNLKTNIPDIEFSGLLFDVFNKDKYVHLRTEYKEQFLSIFHFFRKYGKKDANIILRYVIFMYDFKSPMRKHYPIASERKDICMKLAGFAGMGLSRKAQASVLDLSHEGIAPCMHDLLKYQNNTTWAMLISNEEAFWQYQNQINSPLNIANGIVGKRRDEAKVSEAKLAAQHKLNLQVMENKSKLMKECEIINERIIRYELELFGEEKHAIEEIKKLRHKSSNPESMAS
jgi:hypothetical protein